MSSSRDSFGEEEGNLGEDLPVSHVGNEDDDSFFECDSFVEEFTVFDFENGGQFVAVELSGADAGHEVGAGGAKDFAGERLLLFERHFVCKCSADIF